MDLAMDANTHGHQEIHNTVAARLRKWRCAPLMEHGQEDHPPVIIVFRSSFPRVRVDYRHTIPGSRS